MSEKKYKGNPAWVKGGPSPNPKGKPPKAQAMTHILNEVLSEESVQMNGQMITAKEAVARKLLSLAMQGDVPALKYIYDRMDGSPTQALRHVDGENNDVVTGIEVKFVDSNDM